MFGLFDVDTLNKTFRYQMDIPAGLAFCIGRLMILIFVQFQ